MEEEEIADPLDINKDAALIKEAQNDIGKLDVLVCGKCHEVFHYIEEFQDHHDKCDEVSFIRDNYKYEPKTQVWAFMLWKNAQFRKSKESARYRPNSTSWAVYQKWCKLDLEQKKAWIKAADFIQNNTKIATARLQEIRTKPLFADKKKIIKPAISVGSTPKKEDPLEEGLKVPPKIKSNERDPLEGVDIRASESDLDTEEEVERELARIHGETEVPKTDKKAFKPVQLNSDVTILPSTRSLKKALRTNANTQEKPEEYVVEKILSKRFNPRRRTFEYFIKWENFDSSQNTWEPASHLDSCKAMVEEFEENLRKQKAAKAAKAALERKSSFMETFERTPGGRPQRTSKQKALKQVKSWCGDISEGDEGSLKRKSFSDDDSTDSFEKRMKMEEETDTSEDERPVVTIRKVQSKSPGSINGVAKKPETTIIPETKIIRLSEKQLPGLSSGVYVMSKTEGIIKLDSATPGKGGTVMKVTPKIGQTRIKVVKKDDGSTSNIVKVTPSMVQKINRNIVKREITIPVKPSGQSGKGGITVSTIKRGEGGIKMNIIEKPKVEKIVESEEESDGLEELEFPTDLPLPEPDSPPGEFTLDPSTGKLLGQKTPSPPPEPEPEPEPNVQMLSSETDATSDSPSLDNLVKLAAADLTEEDLKPVDNSHTSGTGTSSLASATVVLDDSLNLENTNLTSGESLISSDTSKLMDSSNTLSSVPATSSESSIETMPLSVKENALKAPKSQIYSIVPNSGSSSSILSTALKNSNIKESQPVAPGQKRLINTPHTIRQKVNVPMSHQQQQPQRMSYISRVSQKPASTPTYIQKVTPGRPPAGGRGGRTYIQKTPAASSSHEPFLKRSANVNTYRNTTRGNASVARKIGHTTIYRTTPVTQNVAQTLVPASSSTIKSEETIILNADLSEEDIAIEPQVIQQQQQQIPQQQQQQQGTVISMPLLTDEESNQSELTAVTTTENATALVTASTDETATLMDVSGFALAEGETPIFITGEDGTIYQVAGQNEDGQTVLITQGPDGQQQCVLVATDGLTEETQSVQVTEVTEDETTDVNSQLVVNTDDTQIEGIDNGEESQVVAQIVKADPPSPGGTRKVVLMLPDGNLMMTDVTAEQYAALELDK
ncbi:uncharacterized protein LOC108733589 isoform X2 [Agrilus planipennis]|uniref:Uncharacterized protein LOC108733589 isoform X2 n=1 Tax=Agrilus planipennis TaxID=224129 RepID=A0A1W4W8B7_AGRPL|nr:uncharacterized protein LOC108733589 isoform X2 [Agrilus planipennis]